MSDHTPDTGTDTPRPSPAQMPVKAPDSPAEARDLSALPEWAQAYIKDLRNEAGGYRTALRAAEQERDQHRDTLQQMQRTTALEAVKGILDDPDDLGRHRDLDELVDDDGRPDPDKFAEAARELVGERPRLAPPMIPTASGMDPSRAAARSPMPSPVRDPGETMLGLMHGGG
ncbi:hypothetical protein G6009_01800 [Dietzia sp. SLG510A3-30A2]|nr:hypothetical protein [Dietzia sp. SLG510A3-30A2]